MEASTVISTLCWIPKGIASSQPKEYEVDQAELQDEELDQLEDEMPVFSAELKRFRGERQKKEGGMEEEEEEQEGEEGLEEGTGDYPEAFEDMSEEDQEDYKIKKSDGLAVVGKVENEFASLEVYIYEKEKYNCYVHHEIQLASFPLCLEHIAVSFDAQATQQHKVNCVAVGTFSSEIEVWDLDVMNAIEPVVTLGQQSQPNFMGGGQKKKKKAVDSHSDSVLCLSLNQFRPNILASGSADKTIKLWDLQKGSSVFTYGDIHSDKVQQVKFNPGEESVLVSAGFDKVLSLMDVRSQGTRMKHSLAAEVEAIHWDTRDSNKLWVCQEDGMVGQIDARKFALEKSLYFQAGGEQAVTSVSSNRQVEGMLVTTSLDKQIKVWDTRNPAQVTLVDKLKPKAGKLNCGAFYNDQPMLFAAGGEIAEVIFWDLEHNQKVKDTFAL